MNDKPEMSLSLDGDIFLIEKDADGKETKHKLDSEICLRAILHVLEKGVAMYDLCPQCDTPYDNSASCLCK